MDHNFPLRLILMHKLLKDDVIITTLTINKCQLLWGESSIILWSLRDQIPCCDKLVQKKNKVIFYITHEGLSLLSTRITLKNHCLKRSLLTLNWEPEDTSQYLKIRIVFYLIGHIWVFQMSYEILITTVSLLQEAGSFLVRGNLISPLPSLSSMVRNVLLFFFLFQCRTYIMRFGL